MNLLTNTADFAFALSSPIRLQILKFIKSQKYVSNKDISSALKMNPASTSQHLKILKQLNLIQENTRLKDNTVILSTVPTSLKRLHKGLSFLFE